ncbi:hypothetical protein [Azorhizobium sp. AG788]|uniref:hypothetical protein n=1 Tax=Azorhizobium sp. AG788 TaxID=2183897 RepID=UPI003138B4CB
MRLSRTLAALLVSGSLILSGAAFAADPIFPRGSLVGLVPPDGMTEATAFPGFEDRAKSASILMVEMPPEAYEQVASGFTDAALASKGIAVISRDPLTIPDTKTMFVTGTQTAGALTVRKWVLLAGTSKGTALITAQIPEATAASLPDETVRAALATIAFRAPPSLEEQLKGLPFHLSSLAGFRVLRVLGNTAVFLTDGPKNEIEAADQPLFVVSVSAGAPRDDDRGTFAVRTLTSTPGFKELRVERAEPLRIHNQPGFEVMATAKEAQSGAEVKVIQWLRFGSNGYVRMLGVVKADAFPDAYPKLRAIRDGFEAGGDR